MGGLTDYILNRGVVLVICPASDDIVPEVDHEHSIVIFLKKMASLPFVLLDEDSLTVLPTSEEHYPSRSSCVGIFQRPRSERRSAVPWSPQGHPASPALRRETGPPTCQLGSSP